MAAPVAVAFLALLAAGGPAATIDVANPVRDPEVCETLIAQHPDDARAFDCWQRYVHWTLDQPTATARLEDYLDEHPGHAPAQLTLARFLMFRDHARALELARAARETFRARGDVLGEGRAAGLLVALLAVKRQFDDPDADGREALRLARAAGDLTNIVNIRTERARAALNRGDAGEAWLIVRETESDPAFDDAPPMPKLFYYAFATIAAWRVDLDRAAARYARAMLELADHVGSRRFACIASNHLLSDAADRLDRGDLDRADVTPLLDRARAACEPFTNVVPEVEFRLLAARLLPPAEAMEQLRIVERKSRENPFCRHLTTTALTRRGMLMLDEQPGREDEALALVREGVREAEAHADAYRLLSAMQHLVRAQIRVGPRDEAVAVSLDTLDAIESLSDKQSGADPPARLIAQFSPVYYAVIDLLLARDEPTEHDRRLAFDVSERLRARRLLTHLRSAALQPAGTAGAKSDLESARLRLVAPASHDTAIATVREALDARTALLAFVVPDDRDRPARVFVVTRDGLRHHALGPAGTLSDAARLVSSAVARRDGSAGPGLERLHRELFADAVASLAPNVDRLVVVPDGPLHGVPFDALRAPGSAEPLVERFTIVESPSARVWLHLVDLEYAGSRRALVLADPPTDLPTEASGGGASPFRGAALGALPFSRDEARAAFVALGRRGELRQGSAAAETAVKAIVPSGFDVLHFATHAVVSDVRPAGSAVLLAAGDGNDGWLTAPEIVDLPLDGALVVLSACRSASGETLRGEGVMSLARAFFMAGASTVVGSLWPVRDREAEALMRSFYERLAAGDTPGVALAESKRARARAGAPAAAWSGFVALGAADRPLPPTPARGMSTVVLVVALVVALALALAAGFISRPPRNSRWRRRSSR